MVSPQFLIVLKGLNMDCLLIIDLQKGFITVDTRVIVPKIQNLLGNFNGFVFATQFVNRGGPFSDILQYNSLKYSSEIELIPFVKEMSNGIFVKHLYSGLTKEFLDVIRHKNIDTVYICGVDTDGCVLKTALDLFEENIKPIVLADFCALMGGIEYHLAGLKVLERSIGKDNVRYGIELKI